MANQWSLYQYGGTSSDTFLPRISEYDEEELSPTHQPDELQGAAMLQEYIDSHPLASSNTSPRQEIHNQLLAGEMVTPGNLGFPSAVSDPGIWDLDLELPDRSRQIKPKPIQLYPTSASASASASARAIVMDSHEPNGDPPGSYSYYQPPQSQYYHYPDPSTSQQQAYAPIYAAPAASSYTPPLLSPQPPYSPTEYQPHGQLTLTQAQYEAAQAQAHQQYVATTSQPPSQYAISDAPSSSSIEDPDVKRQRNTAASARFRAKKKQREQELQASERAKREALQRLEGKVKDLEDENRFLKDLILTPKEKRRQKEKADRLAGAEEEDEGELTEGPGERKGKKGKDGVGTK